MGKNKRKPGTWLMAGGLLLIAAALLLTGYNLWDEWRAGQTAQQVLEQMPEPPEHEEPSAGNGELEIPDYLLNPDMEMPTVEIDGNAYIGTLDIPRLNISLPIMGEWSDAKLKTAPCRFAGSCYEGGFVIAGHNYRTHFGPLDRLAPGDRVVFTCVDGSAFEYEVVELQVLAPTAAEEMTDDGWDLSLFTCTLGGQTRLTVRCEKAETGA